jgi:hypothetical protein
MRSATKFSILTQGHSHDWTLLTHPRPPATHLGSWQICTKFSMSKADFCVCDFKI